MQETFWGLVTSVADEHPNRVVAVDDHGRSLTSLQLRVKAESVAAGLFGHIAGQIRTNLLIVPKHWRGFDHAAMAKDLGIRSWSAEYEAPVTASTALRLPSGDVSQLPAPPVTNDDCRWIYFSSGTTAAPKGVRHNDIGAIASGASLSERLGFGPEDVYPIAWPFTHIGGIAMLVTSLNTGVRLVLFVVEART